jgi:hypothetical protein
MKAGSVECTGFLLAVMKYGLLLAGFLLCLLSLWDPTLLAHKLPLLNNTFMLKKL